MRFGYKEVFEREKKALAVPVEKRVLADDYAISSARLLREAIHNNPDTEWTYKLGSGQQLYVTKSSGKDYGPKVGDIVAVNNASGLGDSIGCHTADHLGTLVNRDCVRLATPDDPGYVATRDEWHSVLQIENRLLMRETFWAWTILFFVIGMLLIKSVS